MKNTQVLVYKRKTRGSLNGILRTIACGKTGRLKMFQMKRLKHTKQAHVEKANPQFFLSSKCKDYSCAPLGEMANTYILIHESILNL